MLTVEKTLSRETIAVVTDRPKKTPRGLVFGDLLIQGTRRFPYFAEKLSRPFEARLCVAPYSDTPSRGVAHA